ncbi:taste receptor type 2 member 9-like [Anomaloglossus baeobatrachus]|uniref:taste receptor type 2 member 9-like n=1 Tax=Anomaloglossus baeobatrachus TaxID=238106 RepID=UPI003F5082A0
MMLLSGSILLIILGILDSGTTFLLNVCILVVGAESLKTGQKMNPPDLIYLLIAVVNIALQCLLSFQGLLSIYFITLLFIREVHIPTIVCTLSLLYLTYWLTAWLCIYYCVTISNFNHPFFLWSKKNISMYLPHLLLLSAAGCFFISLPAIWMASVEVTLQSAVNGTIDPVFISGTFNLDPFYIQTAPLIGCCAPFLLILVSVMLTNSSLIRHVRRMRQKDSGLSQTKDQAHINAVKTMWRFLIISIIFYINIMLFFSMNPNPEDPHTFVCWLIFMTFPTAESLIMLISNPKLRRQIAVKVLRFYRKF